MGSNPKKARHNNMFCNDDCIPVLFHVEMRCSISQFVTERVPFKENSTFFKKNCWRVQKDETAERKLLFGCEECLAKLASHHIRKNWLTFPTFHRKWMKPRQILNIQKNQKRINWRTRLCDRWENCDVGRWPMTHHTSDAWSQNIDHNYHELNMELS